MRKLKPLDESRFWEKVSIGCDVNCWEWLGHKNKNGYGEFWFRGVKKSHRISWEITFGNIPDGMLVCHTCDNPSCVNPNHLFLGTIADNNRDKFNKGRIIRGTKSKSNKLSEEQVIEIYNLRKTTNLSLKKIGDMFGVSDVLIFNIEKGRKWSWLEK